MTLSLFDKLPYLVAGLPALVACYAYVLYPLILWALASTRRRTQIPQPLHWPTLSIMIVCHNEEDGIGSTLEGLLAAPYPGARQILVVSDASTDLTDEIVLRYRGRGVELFRLKQRVGKTVAENLAAPRLRGEIVVHMDATVALIPSSLSALVEAFGDPGVGVASGHDVAVGNAASPELESEAGYVSWEMWLRDLETSVFGIVGASGCLYAVRRPIAQVRLPPPVSRDFVSVLLAREMGWRAVSVRDAVCRVPRATSLEAEYRRKARTMAGGIISLWYKGGLLNPLEHGVFTWMLLSHKLARWCVVLVAPFALLALCFLYGEGQWERLVVTSAGVALMLGLAGCLWPGRLRKPRLIAVPAFILMSLAAGLVAWSWGLRGRAPAVWEPTPRRNQTGAPRPPPSPSSAERQFTGD